MPEKEMPPAGGNRHGAHEREKHSQFARVGADPSSEEFAALAAEFAQAGHALMRGDPKQETAPFIATRWGYLKPLHSLDEARAFLRQIGCDHA